MKKLNNLELIVQVLKPALIAINSPLKNPVGGGLDDFIKNNFKNHQSLTLFQFLKSKFKFPLFKFSNCKKIIAFSLVELMISLITISCIAAAFAPVISKKLKSDTIRAGATSTFLSDCSEKYTDSCKFCTEECCYICDKDSSSCSESQYFSTCKCGCFECSSNEKFNDTTKANCLTCTEKGCTKCKIGYYIDDGQCIICPAGKYCDGINQYNDCQSSVTGGQYCDESGNIKRCNEKFGTYCSYCNKDKCTSCRYAFHVNASGGCSECGNSCVACSACEGKNGTCATCSGCYGAYFLENGKCIQCTTDSSMTNCSSCSNRYTCSGCKAGYYVNSNKKCSACSITNCLKCTAFRPSNSPYCDTCVGGFYINSSGQCASCSAYDTNCIYCNNKKCLSCASGYSIGEDGKCKGNDGEWRCSDMNFMRVGNLCVTRRNMGDAAALSLPSTVIAAGVGELCYGKNGDKCCWKGQTSSGCNSDYSGYSGCNRTVCTYSAANEICEKFNFAGKKWRLPTRDECAIFNNYSYKLGNNGLQLCDRENGYYANYCSQRGVCTGSIYGNCSPGEVWNSYHTSTWADRCILDKASYGCSGDSWYLAYSVRCVTEMD